MLAMLFTYILVTDSIVHWTPAFPLPFSKLQLRARIPRSHHSRHRNKPTSTTESQLYQQPSVDANSPYWSLLQSRYLPNVNDPIASNSLLPFYFTRFPAAALLAQQRYLEESVSTAGPEITTTKPCDNECVADKIDVAVKSVDLLQAIVRISPDAEKKDEKTSEPGRFSAVRSSPLVAFPPPIAFPLSLAPESVGSIRKAPQVSNIKDSIPMTEQLAQSKSTDSCRNLPANLATKSKCSWVITPGQQLHFWDPSKPRPELTVCVATVTSMSLCTSYCEVIASCQSVHFCQDCVEFNCRLLQEKADNSKGLQLKPLINYVDYADKQFCW